MQKKCEHEISEVKSSIGERKTGMTDKMLISYSCTLHFVLFSSDISTHLKSNLGFIVSLRALTSAQKECELKSQPALRFNEWRVLPTELQTPPKVYVKTNLLSKSQNWRKTIKRHLELTFLLSLYVESAFPAQTRLCSWLIAPTSVVTQLARCWSPVEREFDPWGWCQIFLDSLPAHCQVTCYLFSHWTFQCAGRTLYTAARFACASARTWCRNNGTRSAANWEPRAST